MKMWRSIKIELVVFSKCKYLQYKKLLRWLMKFQYYKKRDINFYAHAHIIYMCTRSAPEQFSITKNIKASAMGCRQNFYF